MSSVAPCPLVTAVTQAKKNRDLEGFHLNGNQVPFQNILQDLFVSTQATKERKIERPLHWWRPSVFSKYSTKFICFHTGHKRKKKWKAFTKCFFLKFICFQTGLLTFCTSRGWTPKGQRYQWRITCRGVHACQDSLICGWARGGKRRRMWNEFGCKLQLSKCA